MYLIDYLVLDTKKKKSLKFYSRFLFFSPNPGCFATDIKHITRKISCQNKNEGHSTLRKRYRHTTKTKPHTTRVEKWSTTG